MTDAQESQDAQTEDPSLQDDLRLAIGLADAADPISLDRFRAKDLHVETKADFSPVTDADQTVERTLRGILGQERPDDGILGEEYGTEGTTRRQWILDPIDGTANFLRGVPVWGTLIALAIDGVPRVGVVSSPALGRRWWAARGLGAWVSEAGDAPRRIHVSRIDELSDASISFQSIQQWDQAGYLDRLVSLSRRVWRDRAYGDMWSYMLLAEGLLEAVSEFGVQTYDLAALIPIVEEAGGRFTSVSGDAGPAHGSALATNGRLHDELLAALR